MNILGYLKKNQESFEKVPFNVADVLLFSWVAYFDFYPIKELLPLPLKEFKNIPYYKKDGPYISSFFPKFSRRFMAHLTISKRFENVELIDCDYVLDKKNNAQFAVIAVKIDKRIIIAIRGTDPSYTGWKEDFIMSYKDRIHSYALAESFVKNMIKSHEGKIVLCGHSKGGNICTYLLSQLEDVSRIEHVYSFDGPGFRIQGLFKNKEERLRLFTKIIPQSSFVGVLFSNETDVKIIKSGSVMLLQHNPFFWIIKNNDFVYLKKRTFSSRYLEKAINSWIEGLNEEDRQRFTEIVFDELDKFDAYDFTIFFKKLLMQIKPVYQAYRGLDKNDRKLVNRVMKKLVKNLIKPEAKKETKQIA